MEEILILVTGLVILIAGGELLVRGSSAIAVRFHISPLVVGLTVVAFGTSAPELLVSINAALSGSPDMSMGNVIGSNISNLALILGITAVFSPITVNIDSIRIDWPMAMGSSFLLYILVIEGYLARHEGIMFVLILAAYITFLINKSRKDRKALMEAEAEMSEQLKEKPTTLVWIRDISFILLGCLGLTLGADWFVGSSKTFFLALGIEERVIGVVVLAIGTSLPELVTSLVAAIKKNTDLAVGNLMGSNIFNVLSILGITSIIKDIKVSQAIIEYDMVWMIGVTLIVLPMMIFRKRIGRIQGALLLVLYFYYTYSLF